MGSEEEDKPLAAVASNLKENNGREVETCVKTEVESSKAQADTQFSVAASAAEGGLNKPVMQFTKKQHEIFPHLSGLNKAVSASSEMTTTTSETNKADIKSETTS